MASSLPEKYGNILADLKEKIRTAKTRAALSVNRQLLGVYWEIGRTIIVQQKEEGWGTKVIKRLAIDLRPEFPDMKGLSEPNLRYMQLFASARLEFQFGQQLVAKLQEASNQHFSILTPNEGQLYVYKSRFI
jgi:predicted nuclease of restriction endonuclease-like (RecB) superfamily